MRSHEGRPRSGAYRRARRVARPFRPGWDTSVLEDRVLLAAPGIVVPAAAIVITPTTLPNDTVNTKYPDTTLVASGGTAPYTYAVTTGSLPTGLSLDATTGLLGGTPTVAGSFPFTVTATDSTPGTPQTGSQDYSITINPALAITTTTLPAPAVNAPYSHTLATSGGTGTPTFALSSGTLPAGLTLSSAGLISGTPTAAGPATFGVTATDTAGATATQSYTVTVNQALALNPATLAHPSWTVDVPYSDAVTATGGSGGFTYAVTSGALPTGLNLAPSTGHITGTPSTASPNPVNFTITATDSNNDTVSHQYGITINPAVTFTTTTLPGGTVGAPYNHSVVATGGTGTISYTLVGSLPGGLSLNQTTGAITGMPTAGTGSTPASFQITATDSVGGTKQQTFSIAVSNAISITTTTLPNTSVGVPYSTQIVASGGSGTLTYSLNSGALPPGLTLSPTGLVSGTPTTAGSSTFTVRVADANGASTTQSYSVAVNPKLAITTTTLPQGAAGVPYSQQISATGGTGALTYTAPQGTLPGGLSLSSAGLISGVPTATGTSNFTVTVTDANGVTATQPLALTILPAGSATGPTVTNVVRMGVHHGNTTFVITFSTALDATSAENVSNYTIQPIRHTKLAGQAVPLRSAVYNAANHTVTLTAAGNVALNREYVLTINGTTPAGVKDASGNLLAGLNGEMGTNFVKYFGPEILAGRKAQAAAAAKAVTSLTTAINNSGLTIGDVQAIVSRVGAPGILDDADVPLAVRLNRLAHSPSPTVGAVLDTVLRNLTNPAPKVLSLSPLSIPDTTVGVPFHQTITASGGTAPLSFAVTAGALPQGLNLDATTGAITGTPTLAGPSNFTISALDANNVSGSQPYTVTINPAIAITKPSLPVAAVGSGYSQQITASGGTGALTFAVTSGTLPAGLTLSSTGLLSGTPTAPTGSTPANIIVTATDTVGATKSQAYSLTVNPAIAISPATLPADTVNRLYTQTLTASGGAGGYTFKVTNGALPDGLSLGATSGTISGTPTTAGTKSFTVTVTDTTGNTGSRDYTLTINNAVTITTTSPLPDGTAGTAYDQNVMATGGTGTLVFTLTNGSLPAGLTLTPTGNINGTPSVSGTSTFTVTATDTVNASASKQLSITIS